MSSLNVIPLNALINARTLREYFLKAPLELTAFTSFSNFAFYLMVLLPLLAVLPAYLLSFILLLFVQITVILVIVFSVVRLGYAHNNDAKNVLRFCNISFQYNLMMSFIVFVAWAKLTKCMPCFSYGLYYFNWSCSQWFMGRFPHSKVLYFHCVFISF